MPGYEDKYEEFLQNTRDRPPRDILLQALESFEQEQPTDGPGLAIDLGSGAGVDTLEMLRRGWRVLAVDQQPAGFKLLESRVPAADSARMELSLTPFEELEFPASVDLINASYSLPFCPPEHFEVFWQRLVDSIRPGGRFAGHFFGDRDEWVGDPTINFHTVDEVHEALATFEIEYWLEEDEDSTVASGDPKHWHLYHIVARKR
jgi:SAM-dependent methyltransferase